MILILPFPAERGGRGVSGSPEVTQGRPQRGGGSRGGKGTGTTHSRCNQSGWAFTYSRGRPCRISLGKGPTANKQSQKDAATSTEVDSDLLPPGRTESASWPEENGFPTSGAGGRGTYTSNSTPRGFSYPVKHGGEKPFLSSGLSPEARPEAGRRVVGLTWGRSEARSQHERGS